MSTRERFDFSQKCTACGKIVLPPDEMPAFTIAPGLCYCPAARLTPQDTTDANTARSADDVSGEQR